MALKYPTLSDGDVASYHAPKDTEALLAADQSGSNAGLLANEMTRVASAGKLTYIFDGEDDFIEIPSTSELGFPANPARFAVSTWIKLDSAVDFPVITKCTTSNVNSGWSFRWRADFGKLFFLIRRTSTSIGCVAEVSIPFTTDWIPIGFSFDGSVSDLSARVQFFASGARLSGVTYLQNHGSATGPSANAIPVRLGVQAAGTNSQDLGPTLATCRPGLLTDFRLYNRILTDTEIAQLATLRGAAFLMDRAQSGLRLSTRLKTTLGLRR